MLFYVVLLTVLLCIIYFNVYLREFIRYRKLLSQLPGPTRYPFLGNIPDFLCDDTTYFRRFRQWSKEYGPVYNLSAAYHASANISGAEEFELVASSMKHIKKGQNYALFGRWLGEGLLTSEGSKWQTRRKILAPAFHYSILQKFVPIFNAETDRLVESLRLKQGLELNVVPFISQMTLYSIAETSMGTTLELKNEEDKEYVASTYGIGKIFLYRLTRPWLHHPAIFYKFTPFGKLEKKFLRNIHGFTNKIIRKRSDSFVKFDEGDDCCHKKKLAFLDLLLNAKISKNLIDDKGIKDEVNTFMFAGHDTTSMSICFTLMLLAFHKNIQDAVYQEMKQLFGDLLKHPSLNGLNQLKYMEMVIKESLRLYPSAPIISRELEEDIKTRQGYILPKGALVNIFIFDVHRNPKYWPNPEKFDPDRFLPENCVNRHPFSYVPFSAGPRNCIGQKFAILEIKAVLCGILKNFILEPVDTPDSIVLVPDIVLRTANETLRVKFLPRN